MAKNIEKLQMCPSFKQSVSVAKCWSPNIFLIKLIIFSRKTGKSGQYDTWYRVFYQFFDFHRTKYVNWATIDVRTQQYAAKYRWTFLIQQSKFRDMTHNRRWMKPKISHPNITSLLDRCRMECIFYTNEAATAISDFFLWIFRLFLSFAAYVTMFQIGTSWAENP